MPQTQTDWRTILCYLAPVTFEMWAYLGLSLQLEKLVKVFCLEWLKRQSVAN